MSACKYKRGEYCGLRNDIRAKSLEIKYYCIEGPCPDEKPLTNADRIRAMTDEELAAWLSDMHDAVTCPNGGAIDCNPSCKRCWLDWLKEGVEDGVDS